MLKLGLILALACMLAGCEEPADSGSHADVATFEVISRIAATGMR